jgi:hypothetical protein
LPCNHNAEAFLHAYIDCTGIAADAKGRCSGRSDDVTLDEVERIIF